MQKLERNLQYLCLSFNELYVPFHLVVGENHPNTSIHAIQRMEYIVEVDFVRFPPLQNDAPKSVWKWLNRRKLLMPQNVFIGIRT